MKNGIILSILLVAVFVSTAFAQNSKISFDATLELEAAVKDGKVEPGFKLYVGRGSVYCWVQGSKSYSQAYCGKRKKVNSWLSVSGAVGLETGTKNPFKVAGSVFTAKGNFRNLLVVEKGLGNKSSGLWYRNQVTYQANQNWSFHFVSQKYAGNIGFGFDRKVGKNFSVGAEVNLAQQNTYRARFTIIK